MWSGEICAPGIFAYIALYDKLFLALFVVTSIIIITNALFSISLSLPRPSRSASIDSPNAKATVPAPHTYDNIDGDETAAGNGDVGGAGALSVSPRVCAVQDVDIYRSLGGMLTHVHLLWELVLTGEPIVVMAGSPTDCAHMVQSLMRYIIRGCG